MSARSLPKDDGVGGLFRDVGLVLLIHLTFIAVLAVGTWDWHFARKPTLPALNLDVRVVDAAALQLSQDTRRAEQEAARRRAQERERREQQLAEQRQREQQRAEQQRQQEVARQQALEQQRQRDQQAAREREQQRQQDAAREQQRQAEERRQAAARQRQREQEQARLLEQQRQQELAELRRQREAAERAALAEQQRLEREAALRREREEQERLAEQLLAEQQARDAAANAARQASLREEYIAAIAYAVTNNWLRPATAQSGLRCRIRVIQIPGGEVIDAAVIGPCNADSASQRSIVNAVKRVGDLPYRGYESVFEREITFTFSYDE